LSKRGPELIDPRLAKALEHPIRTDILSILRDGPSSPARIQRRLDNVSLNLVSHHVKVLKDLGCIELVETTSKNGATERIYRAVGPPVLSDSEWDELPPAVRRRITVRIVRRISDDLARSLGTVPWDRGMDTHFSRSPLRLDRQGWREIGAVLERTLDEVLEIGDRSAKRCEAAGEEPTATTVAIMQFPAAGPD